MFLILHKAATKLIRFLISPSSYKDSLSQPAPGMTQRQRLLWLQKRHKTGLWVQCDDCDRWRYLSHILDSKELPNKWYCKMNPGT